MTNRADLAYPFGSLKSSPCCDSHQHKGWHKRGSQNAPKCPQSSCGAALPLTSPALLPSSWQHFPMPAKPRNPFVTAAAESRRKPLQRHLLSWHKCRPRLALAVGGTHLAMASSRSLMACRSRSLASLSSAAPRSRSRSSFSVVISTLSSVTCGQSEAVKSSAAQGKAPQACAGGKATRANLQVERSPGRRKSCVCCVGLLVLVPPSMKCAGLLT